MNAAIKIHLSGCIVHAKCKVHIKYDLLITYVN